MTLDLTGSSLSLKSQSHKRQCKVIIVPEMVDRLQYMWKFVTQPLEILVASLSVSVLLSPLRCVCTPVASARPCLVAPVSTWEARSASLVRL